MAVMHGTGGAGGLSLHMVQRGTRCKPLPARARDTSPLLLDLTNFYNMAPDASYNLIETSMPAANQMPYGIARLDGLDYDIRGRIELRFGAGKSYTGTEGEVHIPERVRGISLPAMPIAALPNRLLTRWFSVRPLPSL